METCGQARWDVLREAASVAGLFLYDLKVLDSTRHEELTGLGNELILENLERLLEAGADVTVRVTVVPGANDDDGSLDALSAFVAGHPRLRRVELLPCHALAAHKYAALDLVPPAVERPESERLAAMAAEVIRRAPGVVLGIALAMTPFVGAAALVAPPAAAALHDLLATGWMLSFNAATGRLRRLPRSLVSRRGLILCAAAAVIGGPITMSGYLFGIKYAGVACALVLSATCPAVGAVLSRVFLREHVTRRGWLGIAVTVTGAVTATYTPPAARCRTSTSASVSPSSPRRGGESRESGPSTR